MKNKKANYLILGLLIALAVVVIIILEQNKSMPLEEKPNIIKIDSSSGTLKEKIYPKARELVNPDGYININNITITENIGKKVILIDFWTYSCINCQRTFPYLTAWHEKYKDKGLLIIGVHTPEFDFEKDYEKVKKAVEKYKIKYPVIQDNNYQTWKAYKNQYWPHKYLIDIDGYIVYHHIGEGAYEETEIKIQELLEERKQRLKMKEDIEKDISKPNAVAVSGDIRTPEIYFGHSFSRGQLGNPEGWQPEKDVLYSLPVNIEKDKFYLSGKWRNNNDNMELLDEYGKIAMNYKAKQINIVAGSNNNSTLKVLIDGKEVNNVNIKDYDLYILFTGRDYEEHNLEITADKGLKAYTFTFG